MSAAFSDFILCFQCARSTESDKCQTGSIPRVRIVDAGSWALPLGGLGVVAMIVCRPLYTDNKPSLNPLVLKVRAMFSMRP